MVKIGELAVDSCADAKAANLAGDEVLDHVQSSSEIAVPISFSKPFQLYHMLTHASP